MSAKVTLNLCEDDSNFYLACVKSEALRVIILSKKTGAFYALTHQARPKSFQSMAANG